MMGIASTNDLRLVEGRVDVLTSKVAALLVRVEKVLSMFNSLPKSADIDRLEVQMSTVKSMIRELSENIEGSQLPRPKQEQDAAAAQAKKLRDGIKSNQD
jgi:hypothetical protein